MAELPKRAYAEVWAARPWSREVSAMEHTAASLNAFTTAWKQAEAALLVYARVEQKYPRHEVVAHKRLGTLTWQLEALQTHQQLRGLARVVKSPDDAITLLAARCITEVPARFKVDSPFGATCVAAFVAGHRAFARATGAGTSRALATFERAVKASNRAPRTHAEGTLKSASAVNNLMKVGRALPWFEAAVACVEAARGGR
jgi:hypothetical protein